MSVIYVIEKEILRECGTYNHVNPMRIWCGNGETFGFSEDYEVVEKKCVKLNSENTVKTIRYVITEVEEII